MQIEQDKVVTFYYELSENNGGVLENNRGQIPMAYLHGHHNLLPALESALAGLKAGDTKVITLPPNEAYGEIKKDQTQRIPIKHLVSRHKRIQPGTLVQVQTENGVVNARIIKAGKFMADVDFNHPFAGKTLTFNVTVEQVRDATPEEINHGHAHGTGGHHH